MPTCETAVCRPRYSLHAVAAAPCLGQATRLRSARRTLEYSASGLTAPHTAAVDCYPTDLPRASARLKAQVSAPIPALLPLPCRYRGAECETAPLVVQKGRPYQVPVVPSLGARSPAVNGTSGPPSPHRGDPGQRTPDAAQTWSGTLQACLLRLCNPSAIAIILLLNTRLR